MIEGPSARLRSAYALGKSSAACHTRSIRAGGDRAADPPECTTYRRAMKLEWLEWCTPVAHLPSVRSRERSVRIRRHRKPSYRHPAWKASRRASTSRSCARERLRSGRPVPRADGQPGIRHSLARPLNSNAQGSARADATGPIIILTDHESGWYGADASILQRKGLVLQLRRDSRREPQGERPFHAGPR